MAGITSAMCTSFKADILSALMCFNAPTSFTATGTSSQTWTSVSSLVGLAVGMVLSGTNVAAGTKIADFLSATSIFVSKASTGALGTVNAVADTFNIALIKAGLSGTYDATTNNYTQLTGNTDEVVGSGYSAGGVAMTNVSPATGSGQAWVTFSPNPSWTSASFTTVGAMIYNNSQRGPTATRAVSVHDFGGSQTVTSGTFTAVMPTAAANSAILRIQ